MSLDRRIWKDGVQVNLESVPKRQHLVTLGFSPPRTEQTWLGSTSFGTQQLTIRVDRNWKTSGWQDILLTTGRSSGSKENKETQLLLLQNGEWPAFQSFSDHQLLLLLISPGTNILSNRLQQPIDTVIGL